MDYILILGGIAVANLLGIISPGPAFLLVGRAAAGRSRATGVATGLGVAAAATLWAAAATFGIAMLMTRFAVLYGFVQIIGGVYLIWLGMMAWRQSAEVDEPPAIRSPAGLRHAALTGFLLSLTNPKIVIFFSSIFVALLPVDTPMWVRLTALGLVAFQETFWYVLIACVFSHYRVQAGYRRVRSGIDRVMGTVFIAFGARIVALARI